jgi:uncharacterized phage-associated protein
MFDSDRTMLVPGGRAAGSYDEDMAYRAADVAAEIRSRLGDVPVKKLHKLLYYCQGHHLAATGQPLFSESVSAWDMGPVVGQLWKSEQEFGPTESDPDLDQAGLNTVGYVVYRYGGLTGLDLERLSHAESPWQRADQDREPGGSTQIRPEWMLEHFRGDLDAQRDEWARLDPAEVATWLAGASSRRREPARPDSINELRRRAHAT